ncbi:major capsid family protein [Leptospira interrogans]|uniref:major capsid family protein n=1 Tax=Leptospira interrogans TaxID=173 RepID=UPI0007740CFF|nr:major capsid family protein [Leptospira interrogans]
MPQAQAIFRKEDSEYIQKRIITPRTNELVARSIFSVNTDTPSYAHSYTVEHVENTGSALVRESGVESDDMPFVGEKAGSQGDKLFVIEAGFRITQEDLDQAEARRQSGRGSEYPIRDRRLDATRQFIAEQENRIVFHGLRVGGKQVKQGLFNWNGILSDMVAANGSGSGNEKYLLKNKNPDQILLDLIDAKAQLEGSGKFKAAGCLIDDEDYMWLLRPMPLQNSMTTLQWLLSNKEVMFPRGFIRTKDLSAKVLKKKVGSNYVGGFCLFDDSPDVAELIIANDLEVRETPWDNFDGNMKVKAIEKIGGIHVYNPKGIVMRYGTNTVNIV